VFVQDGMSTISQPVRRFRKTDKPPSPPKRFLAVAKLLTLASAKTIDHSLLQESFRTLLEDVSSRQLADAVSKQAGENLKTASDRWLMPIFNQELRAARLVMWCPPRKAPIPAIFCPDLQTALFVDLLFFGITACLGCGKLFNPHRPNQVYHDFLCANRHRKRRERHRKTKNKKDGRKKTKSRKGGKSK
jgi:hypothetical protein